MSYFTVTCKYTKRQEDGKVKRVSEKYLCDALSIVEADAIVTENLEPYISDEFFTSKVENSPIAEVMGDKECGRFWLFKVAFITFNEKSGENKRAISQMLVGALDFVNAIEEFNAGMKGTMEDFEIVGLSETQIKEIF